MSFNMSNNMYSNMSFSMPSNKQDVTPPSSSFSKRLSQALTLFTLTLCTLSITVLSAQSKNNQDTGQSGWAASIAAGLDATNLTDQQKKVVIKINQYLNQMSDLKGRFLQINPDDGKQKGKFYLKRPGRIRFDYSPPSLQRVIADGHYLSIEDRDINTIDRYPLEKTPFRILLAKEVNIVRDAIIKTVTEQDETTSITLIDRKGQAIGEIELIFANAPEFYLKAWKVIDTQGQTTHVILSNLVKDEKIDGKLFQLESSADAFFTP